MSLFLYTITIICYHNHAADVAQALEELLKGQDVVDATPVKHSRQHQQSVVVVDAVLATTEDLIRIVTKEVKETHPKVHRFTGIPKAHAETAELRRPLRDVGTPSISPETAALWLPEISVSLVTNRQAEAQATFNHWQRLNAIVPRASPSSRARPPTPTEH